MSRTQINNIIAPELLSRVFEASLEEAQDDGTTLLTLASVCRQWKDVSYRHPQLWSALNPTFTIGADDSNHVDHRRLKDATAKFVNHLERWFSRAGTLPLFLDVTFRDAPGDAFFTYLARCPRWKVVCLRDANAGWVWDWLDSMLKEAESQSKNDNGRPPWPALTSLQIRTPFHVTIGQAVSTSFTLSGLNRAAPNLQALSVIARAMNTPTMIFGFDRFQWTSLTAFDFHGIDEDRNPTFIYYIFDQATNLERLSLHKTRGALHNAAESFMRVRPTPTLPIVHHKLRHLVLALSEDLIKAVMQNVQLPAMRSLQVITAYTASPFASGVVPQWVFPFLHRVSWKHPLFWPQLRQFSFGSDISPCILERGDGDFEQFKADPSAWAERRGF